MAEASPPGAPSSGVSGLDPLMSLFQRVEGSPTVTDKQSVCQGTGAGLYLGDPSPSPSFLGQICDRRYPSTGRKAAPPRFLRSLVQAAGVRPPSLGLMWSGVHRWQKLAIHPKAVLKVLEFGSMVPEEQPQATGRCLRCVPCPFILLPSSPWPTPLPQERKLPSGLSWLGWGGAPDGAGTEGERAG